MNINEAYTFLNFISNKNQSGTVTPSQFNQMATQVQWEYFEKDYVKWQQTQDVTDALAIFLKSLVTSIPNTGQLAYPSDYEHVTSVRHYYVKNNNSGIEVPVNEVDNDKYAERVQSEVMPPTLRFPIWTAYSNYMQFEPKNIGLITFDYFRKPIDPVWGFTIVNNRPVYDPTTSTQWELPPQTHNILTFEMCSLLGINLREDQLVQYSELQKQTLK